MAARVPFCSFDLFSAATQEAEVIGNVELTSTEPQPAGTYVYRRTPHPVFWIMAVALVVIATTYVLRSGASPGIAPAFGQPVSSGGARGLFAFSGQLAKGTYGVYMVDVDAMTLWVYEYQPQKGCMRLAAARTWRYDRYLENYNICDLPPHDVEQMIEEQRQYRLQATGGQMP